MVRGSFFPQICHRNALTEIAWEDAVQGLGMAMSTVASEKNRELLFIGNVFKNSDICACCFTNSELTQQDGRKKRTVKHLCVTNVTGLLLMCFVVIFT